MRLGIGFRRAAAGAQHSQACTAGKGVVRDRAVHERVIREILDFVPEAGFTAVGLDYSPIKGPEGNIEYLCHLKNRAGENGTFDISTIVASSHESL